MIDLSEYFGRRLSAATGTSQLGMGMPAVQQVGAHYQCQRCQQWLADTDQLPNGAWYCRQCLQLGRVTSQTKLYTIPEPNRFSPPESPLTWTGELSPDQQQAAESIRQHVQLGQNQLLWAVTGAGKTEIVYPALAWAVTQGWRIAWVSPRVDVCLELAPRIRAAFAAVSQCLLYGEQSAPYQYSQLTVCTTHQLLRFDQAFDWIIVDEVDAFPLATSPLLQLAITRAEKSKGQHLYLTATPGEKLQRQIRQRTLVTTYLPLRYHGYLLPQLRVRLAWRWRERLHKGRLPRPLIRQLLAYLGKGQRFLLFVPHVRDLPEIMAELGQQGVRGGVSVHAADPERTGKVQALRDQKLSYLVTTTILERGVTFSNIAVVILGGDDAVFSTAALVQIAGRAGRSADFPDGEVTCYVQTQTRVVRRAQAMITRLNRQGKQRGGRRP
ncbi:DEAD/DEAH box helicase [Levilactobacillus fuyuanensis]|uniref:DEAD/DEAH box helicase n=1 Tax=Levilactobacillus fuyuanensis TaxID=2486022 RepID=A0ABW4H662_9LACO|nr:helicase-related protein [Levilactobacillus fuyuanensis]